MKSFQDFLAERYVTAFTPDEKKKYVDEVWNVIQRSYAQAGGIKGSGFKNKEDMIASIPMWKMVRRDGKIVAVALYKDKEGRKRVAQGFDGTDLGRKEVTKMASEDISMDRAFVEISGAAFGSLRKSIGVDGIKKAAKTPKEASKLTGDAVFPPEDALESDPEVGKVMYDNFPELRPFMYSREIGGKLKIKIMVGTAGNNINVK